MPRSTIAAVSLLFTLAGCEANDAGRESASEDAAASAAPAAADIAELRDYELTMENVTRLFEVQRNMGRAASRLSPEEREALAGTASSPDASLDDMAAAIERQPLLRQAVSDAGSSPRDYALTVVAMMQASMAMSVLQMRPNDDRDSLLREMETNPDNVLFIQEHMEEITRMQEAAAAEMQQLFPEGSSDDAQ